MIPVEQRQLHNPDNNVFGDCFSATLASLLRVGIEDIPIFTNDDGVPGSWLIHVNSFLRKYDLAFLVFDNLDNIREVFQFLQITNAYHEIAGDSPRFPGTQHSCVGRDFVVVHDPHPTKLGLTNTTSIGLFVCLSPWRMV